MNKMSKIFFLAMIVLSYILCAGSVYLLSTGQAEQPFIFLLLMIFSILLFSVLWLFFWFKAWAAIQDGDARMKPRSAVLFSLIPLFNLYWMFQMIWGFAKDFNTYVDHHRINAKKLPSKLFLVYVIIVLLNTFIANVFALQGLILSHISLILTLVIVHMVCDAVNGVDTLHLQNFQMNQVEE